jgi:hypothetical protein
LRKRKLSYGVDAVHLARIVENSEDIDARLQELFGVTRAELFGVVREVVGARADSVEDDPNFAEGMFGHIHGVRNTTGLFRSKGWSRDYKDNLALVKHPELPLKVGFQAVDCAARADHTPKAVSGKGSGARRAINDAQLSFLSMLTPGPGAVPAHVAGGLWHLCVSVNGEDVRAELSLSSGVEGGNFKGFIERIFVLRSGEWADMSSPIKVRPESREDSVEFEPTVRRKQ